MDLGKKHDRDTGIRVRFRKPFCPRHGHLLLSCDVGNRFVFGLVLIGWAEAEDRFEPRPCIWAQGLFALFLIENREKATNK